MNLPKNLREAAASAGDGAAIIAAAGTTSSPVTELVNAALGASLTVDDRDVGVVSGAKTHAVALTACGVSESGVLLLTMEGVDTSTTMTADDERDDLLSTSVSAAGIILLSMHMHDVGRPSAAGIPRVMTAIERSLALRVSGNAPVLPRRRLLIVTVTDFDDMETTHEELASYMEGVLKEAYEEIEVPNEFTATTLADVFDVHVNVVRSRIHNPSQFNEDVSTLGISVREAVRTYADAGLSAEEVPNMVEKVSAAIASGAMGENGSSGHGIQPRGGASSNIPSERELKATFACGAAMQSALDKFRNRTKLWRASVDAGRVIPNFASESDKLIMRTLEVYDKDAAPYKSSAAFLRKRDELNSSLLSDSYALFAKQTLKVRDSAYQLFRSKLARIRINDQVEKNVRVAVREAELHFVRNSEALRSKLGNWRFDNERYELVNHMRDDATERLQLARLQGSYVPNVRAPIMFAFHTLLLAPFGRDSRMAAQAPVEDMKTTFDPDKMKQPGMMRTRPYQRGHNIKFNDNRDGFPKESLDTLDKFFEEFGGTESD